MFFRRYQRALRSAGLKPEASIPALTHARSLTKRSEPLARDSAKLTWLYYKLRFGRELLSGEELDEADRLLTRITGVLTGVRVTGARVTRAR